MISNILYNIGEYGILMRKCLCIPTRWKMFYRQLIKEIMKLGVNSILIVFIISFFVGSVLTIQLAINMTSPMIPKFSIGFAARQMILLEFSSSVMCLILAGKVGSSIASELGTMRVTEQIEAMDIMGVNSANFLIMPKIVGFMIFIPVLSIFSMTVGLLGGYMASWMVDGLPHNDYIYGIQFNLNPNFILHSIIKSIVYAFTISSVSSFYGYNVKGGALQVGVASTKAVVNSSIIILFEDLMLTSLMLT